MTEWSGGEGWSGVKYSEWWRGMVKRSGVVGSSAVESSQVKSSMICHAMLCRDRRQDFLLRYRQLIGATD